MERGGAVYTELCFECHGEDGRGTPLAGAPPGVTMAPPIAGSPRVQGHREYVIKVLLHGMTGPVAGRTYTQVMIPMGAQTDAWIADVGSHVRNSFGNTGTFISSEDVARVRAATSDRTSTWTEEELLASLPEVLEVQPAWSVTASHNAAAAADGLTLRGWTSEAPQEAGMWFQVELPEPVRLTEVQFDAAGGGRLGRTGRNGGGPEALGWARGFRVETSLDGQTWTNVASGAGRPLTTVSFAPVDARFVRMTQTASAPGLPAWVIQNLRLYRR
jgi:mono/diheme cytochrome c family protein